MMEKDAKIYVAGHRGMVGSAIVRALEKAGYHNIVTRTHKELNLCRQQDVEDFFAAEKPDYVFLAAAKVGGIVANQEALADFMYDNMTLEMNVIHSAWQNQCKKLLFLGSSCIYPRMAPQPMPESDFRLMRRIDELHMEHPFAPPKSVEEALTIPCFNDTVRLGNRPDAHRLTNQHPRRRYRSGPRREIRFGLRPSPPPLRHFTLFPFIQSRRSKLDNSIHLSTTASSTCGYRTWSKSNRYACSKFNRRGHSNS